MDAKYILSVLVNIKPIDILSSGNGELVPSDSNIPCQ